MSAERRLFMEVSACKSRKFWGLFLLIGCLLLAAGFTLPVWMQPARVCRFWKLLELFPLLVWRALPALAFLGGCLPAEQPFALVFKNTVETNCRLPSSLSAFFLSITGSAGFYCLFVWCVLTAFGEIRLHPLEYMGSISGGSVCLVACILLIGYYYQQRKKHFSLRGIVLDAALMVLFFIPMLSVWNCVHVFLENLI